VFTLGQKINGTGFVVKSVKHKDTYRNVFITCGHNVDSSFPIQEICLGVYENWSNFVGYQKYPCYYYATDRTEDIAIGVFETNRPVACAELDLNEPVYIGDEIFKIGCGLNDPFRLDYGRITSVRSNVAVIRNGYRFSAFTVVGDSGGPIFRDYKVIGLTKAIRTHEDREFNEIAFGIPIKNIKNCSDKLDISIDFVFKEEPLPTLPFFFMKFYNLQEVK